jgi:sulfatase maturation enzyme AslB (radical SAM superfamily)
VHQWLASSHPPEKNSPAPQKTAFLFRIFLLRAIKPRLRGETPMTQTIDAPVLSKPLDFLWLELTNRCNLQCTHCYADSGPTAEKGTISTER